MEVGRVEARKRARLRASVLSRFRCGRGAYAPRVCWRTPRPPEKTDKAGISTLYPVRPGQRSTRGASNCTRGAGALPNSARRCLQKAAEDDRTPRCFAFVRAPDSCASFWTAPVLWHFRPTKTALSRTKSRPRQRAMMRSLAKAEAQPRQGRHRCRNRHKQLPSSVRSGMVRPRNPIVVASNVRRGAKGGQMPPLTGL